MWLLCIDLGYDEVDVFWDMVSGKGGGVVFELNDCDEEERDWRKEF